jgi:sulfur transfer complex TusBCD TusB component (DsrH family)
MLVQILCHRFELVEPYLGASQVSFMLLQEGVYVLPTLLKHSSQSPIAILESDWMASGLAHEPVYSEALQNNYVRLVSAEQWVTLCAQHLNVVTLQ